MDTFKPSEQHTRTLLHTEYNHQTDVKRNANRLTSLQQKAVVGVTAAYRTISGPAVEVIAGISSVTKRARQLVRRQEGIPRSMTKEQLLRKWQMQWVEMNKGRWTKHLTPQLSPWIRRKHGELTYWLTQLLLGHGGFSS
ncbi:uncharacterized protein LOC142322582 [Lycorma delicatula]|uniref:uncharacterized protein LOC142322582 n=1 Tax=Lycorma delicatula TaxID=130591 RepID=UPI003F50ED11